MNLEQHSDSSGSIVHAIEPGISFSAPDNSKLSDAAIVKLHTSDVASHRWHVQSIWYYAFGTYILLLVNSLSYLKEIRFQGALTYVFVAASFLTYAALYVLPLTLLLVCWNRIVRSQVIARIPGIPPRAQSCLVYGGTAIAFVALQLALFVDKTVFHVFGFHLNGFVWNLVLTKGGIESMGSDESTKGSLVVLVVIIVALQSALLAAILFSERVRIVFARCFTRRVVLLIVGSLIAMSFFQQITYGVCSLRGYSPVLAASNAVPLYIPTTFRHLAERMGYDVDREPTLRINMDSAHVKYPLRPINREPVSRPLNIVWFATESLRADMLDPDIMPNMWSLAQQSQWFRHHYSGGNGTRMGMFSMFYGLYGYYWFPFLNESRGPVLIDQLIESGYQMHMLTGAKFTYPEFDKTIFARVESEHLYEGLGQPPWVRDQANIDLMLDFIRDRDTSRPFMTFLFFESSHANYTFPDECVIRKPYAQDLNYATINVGEHMGLIKNRYINACNHVDLLIGRTLSFLKNNDLMDSTIVLFTGDHGEEFMEKGRWGHNSEFTEEQTHTPLVIWIPGQSPRAVDTMTSHLDIPATIMPLLGVTNPPEDYSQGINLLEDTRREYTVICDWNNVAYVDDRFKAVFPTKTYNMASQLVTTNEDVPIEERAEFFETHKDRIVQLMRQLRTFTR